MHRHLIVAFALALARASAAECTPSTAPPGETIRKFQQLDAEAERAMQSEQYLAAVAKYREAACLVPNSGRAFYGLGVAQAAAGDFKSAEISLERAAALLPASPMPGAMLVRVEVARGASGATKKVLRSLGERFPRDAALHSGLARFLAENKLLDLALAESLRASSAGQVDPPAMVALAALENRVGAFDDAIQAAAALESQTSLPAAVRAAAAGVAGLSDQNLGHTEKAIEHLVHAVELDPRNENSYLSLAYLYEKAARFRDAVALLERGHRLLPDSVPILYVLGSHLVWSEQYDAGIRALNAVISKAPNQSEAYLRLAEAYRNMGKPESELTALDRLAAVNPAYPMLHVLAAKAILTASKPDYNRALFELAAAEKISPGDADIFYLRGKVYVGLTRYSEAIEALRHAIELRPLEPSPYYQLGLAYRRIGNAALAEDSMRRMQRLKPQPQTARP